MRILFAEDDRALRSTVSRGLREAGHAVEQAATGTSARELAAREGIFCGISAAGACVIAQRIAEQVEEATIVFIVCDRGDRYLSTGVFPG